ncbi:MAG: uracil-DNA glycosylase [Bacteroidota bacterium]|nr:MAG: uracil-DNA glycosylase [Bacteroidota bacterium]
MNSITPKLHESWKQVLKDEFESPYFLKLKEFLVTERNSYIVYPKGNLIFNALDRTPFDQVRVVLLGQDPYHGPDQAHGLSFSVPFGIKPPPSLVNIYKELSTDCSIPVPHHGNLEKWASQGVLLLNSTLTVRANQAGSHQGRGWELFTNSIICKLSEQKNGIVFLLWGRFAQQKLSLIDQKKHFVLLAAHPSPLSAYQGFFGCKHFSKTNELLLKQGLATIDWNPGEGGIFA